MANATKRRNAYRSYNRMGYDVYDGSAARQLEQGAEVLQPRPQVRPRERTAVRPRVQVREAGAVSAFAVTGFLAVAMLAVVLLFSCVQLNAISDQVVAARSEIKTLQGEEAKLRTQYELAYDLSSIEQEVGLSGTMVKPRSGQVFYVDLSEPDSVEFFLPEEAPTGFAGIVSNIKSACAEIMEYFR